MRKPPTLDQEEEDSNVLAESYLIDVENDWLGFGPLANYNLKILDENMPAYQPKKLQ